MEDENNDYICFTIYNYEKNVNLSSHADIDRIFQVGSFIVVFESYYKVFLSGTAGIRVDDQDEIILFKDKQDFENYLSKKKMATAEELKLEVNKLLAQGQPAKGLVCFLQAISRSKDNDSEFKGVLYSNTAEAYLRLGCNVKAQNAAQKAIENWFVNEKIFFRKAKALFNLVKYQEYLEILNGNDVLNGSEISETKENVKNLKNECLKKLENQKFRKFDFVKMVEEEKKSFYKDYANYVSEKVEISFCEAKRITVKAIKEILKGELISATKAFACKNLLKMNEDDEFFKTDKLNNFDKFFKTHNNKKDFSI